MDLGESSTHEFATWLAACSEISDDSQTLTSRPATPNTIYQFTVSHDQQNQSRYVYDDNPILYRQTNTKPTIFRLQNYTTSQDHEFEEYIKPADLPSHHAYAVQPPCSPQALTARTQAFAALEDNKAMGRTLKSGSNSAQGYGHGNICIRNQRYASLLNIFS